MSTDLMRQDATRDIAAADPEEAAGALQHILSTGDLSKLSNGQRVHHYLNLCASLGLNPASRPFDWIEFYDPETRGKKLQLYANQSAAAQLRRNHQISTRIVRREIVGDLFVVEAEGTAPNGRMGQASKYVPLTDRDGARLNGQRLANAYMKGETGALRRLTLAMIGLSSLPDSDELSRARVVTVDGAGNILENPTEEQKALAADPRLARVIGEPTFEDMDAGEDVPGLEGYASQAPTPDELEPERTAVEMPSFKPTKAQVNGWLGAWFATVKGTKYDTDEARHRFAEEYTANFPPKMRGPSLRVLFERSTPRQAGDILERIRALVAAEQAPADDDTEAAF